MAKLLPVEPGIKVAAQVTPEPSEDELAFIRRMWVEYVVLWARSDKASYEYYTTWRALFEDAGLRVYGFGNTDVHNQDAIVLGLPNRDEKIEEYKAHLRNLGRAGIPYTTYAHMAKPSKLFPWLRKQACASAFTPTTRRYPSWAGSRARSLAVSRDTSGRSRSPTAPAWACACAWAVGWRAGS